jgi:hypothetical protein
MITPTATRSISIAKAVTASGVDVVVAGTFVVWVAMANLLFHNAQWWVRE